MDPTVEKEDEEENEFIYNHLSVLLTRLFGPFHIVKSKDDLTTLIKELETIDYWKENAKQTWISNTRKYLPLIEEGYGLKAVINYSAGGLNENSILFLQLGKVRNDAEEDNGTNINARAYRCGSFRVPGRPVHICYTEQHGLMFVVAQKTGYDNLLLIYRGRHCVLQVSVHSEAVFALSARGDMFVVSHPRIPGLPTLECVRFFQLVGSKDEKSIQTGSPSSITSLAIFPDSSHIVIGTSHGDIGLIRGTEQVKTVNMAEQITAISLSRSWVVVLCETNVRVFSKRLEPIMLVNISYTLCASVSWDEKWIVFGGRSGIVVFPTNNDESYLMRFQSDVTAIVATSEWVICGTSDGRVFLVSTNDLENKPCEAQVVTQRGDLSVCAVGYSHEYIFSGWTDNTIQRRNMIQSITPKSVEQTPKKDLSMFGVDVKEPITDKQRQVVLRTLFQGTKIPPYNFDDIVRLYVACSRKSMQAGTPNWTSEQRAFLELVVKQCVMVAKREHAGAVPLLMEIVEVQLRLLYILM